jgi:hypothetical protein
MKKNIATIIRMHWKSVVTVTVAAGIAFWSGMTAGARIERAGHNIELRSAINRCEASLVADFEIVPDKVCRAEHPVNYIYVRNGNLAAGQKDGPLSSTLPQK